MLLNLHMYIYELISSLHVSHPYVIHFLVQDGHPTIGNGNIYIVSICLTTIKWNLPCLVKSVNRYHIDTVKRRMEGISQVSDEYQIHPLLSEAIISYFPFNKLIKLSLKSGWLHDGTISVVKHLDRKCFYRFKKRCIWFPILQKAEHRIAKEYNLIQLSFVKSIQHLIRFWLTTIFSRLMTLLQTY